MSYSLYCVLILHTELLLLCSLYVQQFFCPLQLFSACQAVEYQQRERERERDQSVSGVGCAGVMFCVVWPMCVH